MYGNYVIQHVLERGRPEDRARMVSVVTPQLLALSKHKNASNVVEKCILLGTPEEQRSIRDQLMGDDANSPLFQLMKDQFGNYVIRKLVASCYFGVRQLTHARKTGQGTPGRRQSGASQQTSVTPPISQAIRGH